MDNELKEKCKVRTFGLSEQKFIFCWIEVVFYIYFRVIINLVLDVEVAKTKSPYK